MRADDDEARVREILKAVKPQAAEYYRLTGKPLGVTGEVAEYVAAETLGLTVKKETGCNRVLKAESEAARVCNWRLFLRN